MNHFLTRRKFLQRAAFGTAGLVLARPAFARGGKDTGAAATVEG